jgi:hypothetical protein
MNEIIAKIYPAHFVENQVLQFSFEQSLYSSVSRSVQAGDSRAIQRLMLQVAGTMFLQSYRAGKYKVLNFPW